MKKTILSVFIVSFSLFSQDATVKTKINIAVSPLEGRGLAEGEAGTLTDALATHLANTVTFRVMERGRMDVILKEQGFQQSGACNDAACIVEMGQLLGVDHMVTGSIGKVGQTYSINLRIINVGTGEIVRSLNKYYKGEIDGVLTEVLPTVALELSNEKETAIKTDGAKEKASPVVSNAKSPALTTQTDKKFLPFVTNFGLSFSVSGNINKQGKLNHNDSTIELGNIERPAIALNARLFKRVNLMLGIAFHNFDAEIAGKDGDIAYWSTVNQLQPEYNGRLDVSMKSTKAAGITSGIGLIFYPANGLNMSINSSITSFTVNLIGKQILPNITVTTGPNVFGHEDPMSPDNFATITVFCTDLKLEKELFKRFALFLSIGYTSSRESWTYSDGHNEWSRDWIITQPNDDTYFELKGASIGFGAAWYWR